MADNPIMLNIGVTDFDSDPDKPWFLPGELEEFEKKILLAVQVNEAVQDPLINKLVHAVKVAIASKKLSTLKSEIKRAISKAEKASQELSEALRDIPAAGDIYFQREDLSRARVTRFIDGTALSLSRISQEASEELSGRGKTKDQTMAVLAFEIAETLDSFGVKLSIYRPTENRSGETSASDFWQVTDLCFQLAGVLIIDLIPYLENAREHLEKSEKRNQGGNIEQK